MSASERQNKIDEVLHEVEALSSFALARLADVSVPDTSESPGAEFLIRVRGDVTDRLRDNIEDDEPLSDAIINAIERMDYYGGLSEVADAAVPIYTHARMQTLVDLAAYYEEDIEPADFVDMAGQALFMVAERLGNALLNEIREAAERLAEGEEEG